MSKQLIQALLEADCYPHPSGMRQVLETHISWVLLIGEFAYKIKKPVNLGFLDFSSLEKRRFYCVEELRLNQRFSDDLYLDLVTIRGSVDAPRLSGSGEVLEYAVKMRRFPQEALLDHLAEQGGLDQTDALMLAQTLADFHRHRAAPLPAEDKAFGSPSAIAEVALQNFSQMARLAPAADAERLARLEQWTREELVRLEGLLATRRQQGFVRECHGDLHLGNIARIDGRITFFDCIEFSPALRYIDQINELAFLLMDMEDKGQGELANRVLNHWLEFSGDYAGIALLPFYKVYRALVRAKVKLLAVAETADENLREEGIAIFRGYLAQAEAERQPRRPFLALMHGVSGSGKSYLAARLAALSGGLRLRSDVERKRLFGLDPLARSGSGDKDWLYSREASDRTFARLYELAEALLALGWPVYLDATFISAARRAPFLALGEDLAVPRVILACQASEALLQERLRQRAQDSAEVSEADLSVMRDQLAHVDPFSAAEAPLVLAVDSGEPLPLQALRNRLGPAGLNFRGEFSGE